MIDVLFGFQRDDDCDCGDRVVFFPLLLIPQDLLLGRCFGVGTRCLSFCVCLRGKEGEGSAEREGSEEQQVKGKSETETEENRGKEEESVGDETNGIGGEWRGLKGKREMDDLIITII